MKKVLLATLVCALGSVIVYGAENSRENWPLRTPQSSAAPRINGAKVFGVRPGSPILYAIPASGSRPMTFSADTLPRGVTLDSATGLFSGTIADSGVYSMTLKASNSLGSTEKTFRFVVADTAVQLTPPMGWNSWYVYSESVSDTKIRTVAEGMKKRGLADHGWNYINIDDCWQSERGGKYNAIQGNERFHDMKGLGDYIHSLGLRFGIYSTPWVSTYAGFIGGSDLNGEEKKVWIPEKERHQKHQTYGRWPGLHNRKMDKVGTRWLFDNDIRQWADWGIDYIKIDWKPNDIPTTQRIAEGLRKANRDIVLSLSNEAPLKNAAGLANWAQLWRTTGDIHDGWGSISNIGFNINMKFREFSAPGRFNDPDMLQVGDIGVPNSLNVNYRPSRLTAAEQYTQVSLWSLMASPLLVSCNIAGMDPFTYNLLTNDEIIDINQDPLCIQCRCVFNQNDIRVMIKPLENGDLAVGVFNLGKTTQIISVTPEMLELKTNYTVRDVWYQKDLGALGKAVTAEIGSHDCAVYRLTPLPAKP